MKFKKITYSTMLSDLYGRDNYQSHIEAGRDYWYYFPKDSEIENGWHKIRVTYIRSGCMFYFFPDNPEVKERFCPLNCFMASQFVLAEIDPEKDMAGILDDIEMAKKMYRFNSERTVVKNWPNEETVEIEDNDITSTIMTILVE